MTKPIMIPLLSFLSATLFPCQTVLAAEKPQHIPAFKKVILVLFENENFDKPLSQPFFSKLANEGALLTNYHAVTHPSQPNYIALTAGDTLGITDDRNYDLDARHLGDLLEEKGKTWKNYAENYPGHCFLKAEKNLYARKHVPFLSYANVTKTARCKNIVDSAEFFKDMKNGTLPDFSFYTPNIDNDEHDTDIGYAEAWFKKTFGPLIGHSDFKNVLLITTFDENACGSKERFPPGAKLAPCDHDSNQVYTVLYGRGIKPASTSNVNYTHYNLLRTIEEGFGLSTLGRKDLQASVISGIWNSN